MASISDLRARGEFVWAEADVKDLADTDAATIAQEFSLHELAVVNDGSMQRRIYSVKQRVSRLRRYGHLAARVVQGVLELEAKNFADSELVPMFAHVKDHALRIGDQVSGVESLTNAILDLRRAEQASTLNEVTKKLTAWAAIIAVPTLISSVYGMNVRLYPPEDTTSAFWFALGLMAFLGVGLFVFFKRRHWL